MEVDKDVLKGGVYDGYNFFREYGRIVKVDFGWENGRWKHGATHIFEGGRFPNLNYVFEPCIEINKNDPLEVQVQTLIHEFIHLAPKYLKYPIRNLVVPNHIEREIERKALEVYEKEPLFVWYFRKLVQEAKEESGAVVYAS